MDAFDPNDLADLLQYADEDTIDALVSAGLVPARAALAKQQMGFGQSLMDTPSPQGAHVGNTYVASSPLEHLAAAMRQGIGARKMQGAMAQQGSLLDQQGAASAQGWAQALRAMRNRSLMPAGGIQTYEPPAEGTGGEF